VYYITYQNVPGKNKTRRYAYLKERINFPGGGVSSVHVAYLGKDPVAAIQGLYSSGRLTLEQVLSISERNKIPGLVELKEQLRREATHND